MGLALTDLPISTGTISANPATFLDDLHALLIAAGWASAVYDNGHVYAIESPQSLAVQVRIWYPDAADFDNCFAFQFVTSTSPPAYGHIHHLRSDAALTYFVWANCCSFFIARPGVTHSSDLPWSVCGGIPYAFGLTAQTDQCAGQSPNPDDATTELWFSAGSDSGVASFAAATVESFRSGHYCKRYSFCRNGAVTNVSGAVEGAALVLGNIRPAGYESHWISGFHTEGILFGDDTPLASDPLLSHRGVWYGQLYDACLLSKPMALEATEEIYESEIWRLTEWVNHTSGNTNIYFVDDEGRIYSLLLLTGYGAGSGVENIAY